MLNENLTHFRLTKQIAVAVTQAVQPSGVAVIIEGVHMVR